jgi:prepilin-type N-terminal cleavage/methylation domain-containing protein
MFRTRLRDESGLTLPELMVAMIVSALILSAFLTIMVAAQRDIIHQQNRTRTNDNARVAIEQVDRELRSGTYVADPAFETDGSGNAIPYYGMHFQTQANGDTRGGLTCVQYRIANDRLQRRSWPSGSPGSASGWWTVANGVVNVERSVPAFQFSTDPNQGYQSPAPSNGLGSRLVNVVLVINAVTSDSPDERLTDSLEIRNQTTVTGDPCTPPAG